MHAKASVRNKNITKTKTLKSLPLKIFFGDSYLCSLLLTITIPSPLLQKTESHSQSRNPLFLIKRL